MQFTGAQGIGGEVVMWPGSRIHLFETMRNLHWEDYILTHTTKNLFGYFGNGFTGWCTMETGGSS